MRLEHRAPAEALGCVLTHAVPLGRGRLSKGTVLGADAIARLAGIASVEVAVPEPGDVGEDEAARRCAAALLAPHAMLTADPATTGRVNLRAGADGLFLADRATIDALNAIDPRLTVATLHDTTRVERGALVGTLKIIPFFAPEPAIAVWEARAADAVRVAPWRARRIAHVSTVLGGTKASVLDKTRAALAQRLAGTGATLADERRVPHERAALAAALAAVEGEPDVIVVFGASAVTDAADVVPSAIVAAGGTIERVGMPVDPGNLLVWGRLNAAIVLGAPGCARSVAPNGFDWALSRALAGIDEPAAIAALGVGGLLKETPRGRPREAPSEATDE